MKYFKNVTTAEELKRQYRMLVLEYHPDRNGNQEAMAEINREYEYLLRTIGNIHEKEDGTTWEEKSDFDRHTCDINDIDDGFRETLLKLLRIKDIEILLVGSWLWISGKTREHKEEIKMAGCRWSAPRKKWYWHKADGRRHHASKKDFEAICNTYKTYAIKNQGMGIVAEA